MTRQHKAGHRPGWFVEIRSLGGDDMAGAMALAAAAGRRHWRMSGSLRELLTGGISIQPHPAWAMNSHGVYDTHLPDRWSFVHFSEERVEDCDHKIAHAPDVAVIADNTPAQIRLMNTSCLFAGISSVIAN